MEPDNKKLIIDLVIDSMPPTGNRVYQSVFIRGHPRKALSKEARDWKNSTTGLTRHVLPKIGSIEKNKVFHLDIIFYMDNILNKTYPEKATTPYKQVDVSNRVKLAEDAFKDLVGIDDSQFFSITSTKIYSETEKVVFKLFEVHPKHYGVPENLWNWSE